MNDQALDSCVHTVGSQQRGKKGDRNNRIFIGPDSAKPTGHDKIPADVKFHPRSTHAPIDNGWRDRNWVKTVWKRMRHGWAMVQDSSPLTEYVTYEESFKPTVIIII